MSSGLSWNDMYRILLREIHDVPLLRRRRDFLCRNATRTKSDQGLRLVVQRPKSATIKVDSPQHLVVACPGCTIHSAFRLVSGDLGTSDNALPFL